MLNPFGSGHLGVILWAERLLRRGGAQEAEQDGKTAVLGHLGAALHVGGHVGQDGRDLKKAKKLDFYRRPAQLRGAGL